jgi:hypothetical protein
MSFLINLTPEWVIRTYLFGLVDFIFNTLYTKSQLLIRRLQSVLSAFLFTLSFYIDNIFTKAVM